MAPHQACQFCRDAKHIVFMEIYIKILPLTQSIKSSLKYLGLILIFALLLRLVFFSGADHSDSLLYYTYSHQVADGTFKPTDNHFSSRIGLIYPQGIIYRIFGVNEFSSNVLSLIISLAGIILIFCFGKMLFSEKAGLVAAFLLSFFPLDVIFSTRLLPDFPAAFFMALAVFLFLKAEKSDSNVSYFVAGLSWGIAYLIKEISILMALFFLVYAIYRKKLRTKYILVGIGFALLILIELWNAYSLTGNAFYRHTQIESEEVAYLQETYSNYFTPFGMLSRLLLHWPFLMLHDAHYGLFFIFIFIALFYCIFKRKESSDILLIWIIALTAYLNFGTLSFRQYIPIPITAKFLSIIMFPSILILAYFLSEEDKTIKKFFMPASLIILLLSSIGFIYLSDERFIINEAKQAYSFVKNSNMQIYTDERTKMVLDYLSGFKSEGKFIAFNKFDLYSKSEKNSLVDLRDKHNVLILVNNGMINGLPKLYKDIKFPEQVSNIPKSWQILMEFGSGDKKISIYYAQ